MMIRYYYLRDRGTNAPRVTKCIVRNKEGDVAIGSAICSFMDIPNKRVGRRIAYNRAMYALNKNMNVLPIESQKARSILSSVPQGGLDGHKGVFLHRKEMTEYLTSFEKRLLRIEE